MSPDRTPRRRLRGEGGFTLVEVMVALGLLTVVMTASLPVLVSLLRTGVSTRMETQARNLAQERLEQVRDLRFHIDRQNGPFLDLLDLYYTHATAGRPGTAVVAAGATLSGTYVASGVGAAGEPAGPYYRTLTGPLPGAPAFSQRVLAQFLGVDGAPLPPGRFPGYDSQVVGRDRPPTLLLGLTVITEWTVGGKPRSFSTYTRLTDGRPQLPLVQSQARGVAVDISSTAADGATVQLQGGLVSTDGSQSSGSAVSGYAVGALARRSGADDVTGRTAQFDLPARGTTDSGSASASAQNGPACSWYGFGATEVADVTGDVAQGLPKAPADVDLGGAEPKVLSAAVLRGGGGPCGQLSYDNTVGGGVPRSGLPAPPYVTVPDPGGGGRGVQASGYVTSTGLSAPVRRTSAGARAAMTDAVVLFPGWPGSSGRGLVSARLTTARLDCVSGASSAAGTVTGRYTLTLGWWGVSPNETAPRWHVATWDYDSTRGSAPLIKTGDPWNPQGTFVEGGPRLSDLVTGDLTPAAVTAGGATGLRGFPRGVFSLTTAPTLQPSAANGFQDGVSSITARLGQLSCVADDRR